ncbi:YfcC family protein [Bifidobacterium felsineum]|uniref:C4-dicarboxylate ABC transporter n=1 Tax=Bifidobacterium felsineum TaxID=2045440 RepID=A0A2M9HL58_9BIFI|nr:Na+/H+ antiporter NhaC family protein [Bifidobacterium felsineum]MBT1163033.1 putative basic amino acid antiporter YfcC [Bifidobacterium felsineum]PJM77547.1 C4-dicarboxylate ABC transporter [Bifidobacterium felsineum]
MKLLDRIKKIGFPHSYALLFFLIIICAVLTWIVPSGQYDTKTVTVDGSERTVVVPGTYHQIAKIAEDGTDYRQGLGSILEAPGNGIIAAVEVIAFVLILGGAFGIILKTGAIDRGLRALADFLGTKGILVIPLMMILVSLGGSTYGMSEELIPLFIIFITFMLSMGFDSMTAILTLFLASQVGYIGSTINPFNVLIAQGIGDVHGNPLLWLRLIYWAVFTIIAIAFTMRYAFKVRKNPESSVVYDSDLVLRAKLFGKNGENTIEDAGKEHFTGKDKAIITVFILGLAVMVYGIVTQGWYMTEIGALFLAMGLIIGIIARFSVNDICEAFVSGCADFVYAAVIIGLANSILVILQNGMIIDTILNGLAGLLGGLPKALFTTILLAVQAFITLFVPSSSGSAALTMPVMGPLADLVNINRDVIVLSNQFGNGLMNIINPTGGVLLAGLSVAGISFGKWLKVGLKAFGILFVVAAVFLWVATLV